MAKRNSSKIDFIGTIILIIISIPVLLFNWITEHKAWGWVLIGIIIVTTIIIVLQKRSQANRYKYLQDKYQDPEIVEKIMQKYIWEGQSEDQLLDSLGQPVAVDNHLLKTRTRQVWKYRPSGRGKYNLRVTLDNGHVVAWDQRN